MALIIETPRLVFRHQVPADLEALWSIYQNPKMVQYIPDAPKTLEEAREELEWHMNGHPADPRLGLWATIHKETGKFIGRCGLLPWELDGQKEVEVAYMISEEYQGLGLGSEAALAILNYGFDHLGLTRLVSLIDPDNKSSIRVAEKMGMKFEKEGRDEIGSFLLYSVERSGFSPPTIT